MSLPFCASLPVLPFLLRRYGDNFFARIIFSNAKVLCTRRANNLVCIAKY